MDNLQEVDRKYSKLVKELHEMKEDLSLVTRLFKDELQKEKRREAAEARINKLELMISLLRDEYQPEGSPSECVTMITRTSKGFTSDSYRITYHIESTQEIGKELVDFLDKSNLFKLAQK